MADLQIVIARSGEGVSEALTVSVNDESVDVLEVADALMEASEWLLTEAVSA
jgi:hypothetical protein